MPDTQEEPVVVNSHHQDVKIIIIVEDDSDIGEVIVSTIQDATPYHATLYTDGLQVLKAVETLKPNLFVLDYHLPSMTGIELYDKLHEMPELQTIPTLMMSASFPKHELEKRHLPRLNKPFDINELLDKIAALLT